MRIAETTARADTRVANQKARWIATVISAAVGSSPNGSDPAMTAPSSATPIAPPMLRVNCPNDVATPR